MKYLALGDSYTIGELVEEKDNFPNQLTELLRKQYFPDLPLPTVIAKTGWTSEELYREVESRKLDNDYDFVSLLIGVNDQYKGLNLDDYKQYFLKLLIRSILLATGQSRRVFVLSIPDWSVTPFAAQQKIDSEKVAKEIDEFNKQNKLLALAYRCHYLDITPATRKQGVDESFLAADKLHYSPEAYKDWAKKACRLIGESVKNL